jgi:hypothetical protein
MNKQENLAQQLKANFHLETEINLFYDWFCTDKSLQSRGKTLVAKLRQVMKINQDKEFAFFDPQKVYVIFKNNCPLCGKLYDDFRICDMETGDVVFTIAPRLGYSAPELNGKASMHGRLFNGKMVELVTGEWQDVLKFFKGE